jgi:dihydroxy-acid dehydratase
MKKLRSQDWFGPLDKNGFIHRSWMKNQGWPHDLFDGRPIIGICNTWSELTPCNAHFRELADFVKRGVWEAGAFPLEFPVMSLGETVLRPTAMLFRNLASMDVEGVDSGNPLDGVVLLMGCDKTTPSANGRCFLRSSNYRFVRRPDAVGKVSRPRSRIRHGRLADDGKDPQRRDEDGGVLRSGKLYAPLEGSLHDHGTASTMASMVEALGMICRETRPFQRSMRDAIHSRR